MYTKFSVIKKIFLSVGIFTATQNAYAGELKGTVKNSVTGEKIQNVSVTNQDFGVVTDLNGFFSLKNLEEKDCELKFSYVGFATKTLKLKPGENSFVILLEPEKQNIDEVFVTDSRAKQNETPVTFSNFSNENIEKKYTVQDLPILVSELPSVNFYSETGTGLGASYLSIRGFDQKRIAVTVNGVPQNDPEDHNVYWYDFTDLASNLQDVQIQRGAGNTSYGHAAIGGSVNLETKKYSTETKLALQGGLGSFGTKKFALIYDSGLINSSYALSGKFSKTVTDGYRDKSFGEFTSYFFSGTKITENSTTTLNVYGGPLKDHLTYEGVPKDSLKTNRKFNSLVGNAQIEEFRQDHYELINDWQVSKSMNFTNTFYYVDGNGYFDYFYPSVWGATFSDFGLDSVIVVGGDTLNASEMLVRGFVDNDQFGWIPKFTFKNKNYETVYGFQVLKNSGKHTQEIRWASFLPVGTGLEPNYDFYHKFEDFDVEKNTLGGFAKHTQKLEKLTLFGSTELVFKQYDLVKDAFSSLRWKANYLFFNPRFGANYEFSDKISTYVSFAKTSREPRRKDVGDGTFADFEEAEFDGNGKLIQKNYGKITPKIKEETLYDFEIGTSFRNEVLSVTGNFYLMEFRNELIKTGTIGEFGSDNLINAKKSRHSGFELSGVFLVFEELTSQADKFYLKGNLNLSKNRVLKFSDQTDVNGNRVYPRSWENNPVPSSPELLANFGFSYTQSNFSFDLDGKFVGKQFLDSSKNEQASVGSYFVLNSIFNYKPFFLERMNLKLAINNLLDKKYETGGYVDWDGARFFPAAARNYFLGVDFSL